MKVKFIMLDGSEFVADVNKNVQLSAHFKLWELANNKGNAQLPQYVVSKQSMLFNNALELFRIRWGKPINPTSGYRQPAFNAAQKGASSNSAHLYACACDFLTNEQAGAYQTWKNVCNECGIIGAINFYSKGVHLEAFSNLWYKSMEFAVRDYRGTVNDWK